MIDHDRSVLTRWNILYRGSLTSCNFACGYCPFAKTKNTREELQKDNAEVDQFVDWVAKQTRPIGILFTPWGEAIIHHYYRAAMVRLSKMENVHRVAMQTNLSSKLNDLADANRDALALWATYHPGEVSRPSFLARCNELDELKIRYSVGVVGLREHFEEIVLLRRELPREVYLWVNCYKREPNYYSAREVEMLREVDPYFDLNRVRYHSLAKPCFAGSTTFTVDGAGDVRRCHFIDERLGNIYEHDVAKFLRPRLCTNETCGCHIGYVHRPELELYNLFGESVLERIPSNWPHVERAFAVT